MRKTCFLSVCILVLVIAVVSSLAWAQQNTSYGQGALSLNTTGNYNSAFGYGALDRNTIGSNNSAFGYGALNFSTIGSNNSAFGSLALIENDTGSNNSAFGHNALLQNGTGSNNNAFGYNALNSNEIGGGNNAFGHGALSSNTTGWLNNAFGYRAGYKNEMGIGNVFLGTEAGYHETGSNKLYIANSQHYTLIYGDFATDRVGIGTTNPEGKLTVQNNSSNILDIDTSWGGGTTLEVRTSDISGAGGRGQLRLHGTNGIHNQIGLRMDGPLWVDEGSETWLSGNVGIGTTNPQTKLDVEGTVQAHAFDTGDIVFRKDGEKLWRMFEDEKGLYLESLKTGETSRIFLEKDIKALEERLAKLEALLNTNQ